MTLIIAHRGASVAERENTLAAFEAAGRIGAEGVELDVRRTADHRLVVHHNPHLDDGRALCATLAADLPDHVPTFEAALDACAGMFVNVEIKNDPEEPDFDPSEWVAHQVCGVLVRRGGGVRWLISSFRFETVGVCRTIAPGLRTAWLTLDLDEQVIADSVAAGHVAVHPWEAALDAAKLTAAHAAGLTVNTWTCDDPERLRLLISWGIDGICTNVPDVALGLRRSVASGL